jgi:hypothetical protein
VALGGVRRWSFPPLRQPPGEDPDEVAGTVAAKATVPMAATLERLVEPSVMSGGSGGIHGPGGVQCPGPTVCPVTEVDDAVRSAQQLKQPPSSSQ